MFLSALTLAAMLQAAPMVDIPSAPPVQLPAPRVAKETRAARELKAWQANTMRLADCNRFGVEKARGEPFSSKGFMMQTLARRTPGAVKQLGDLPDAHGYRAVIRKVDGCPVSSPIVQVRPVR